MNKIILSQADKREYLNYTEKPIKIQLIFDIVDNAKRNSPIHYNRTRIKMFMEDVIRETDEFYMRFVCVDYREALVKYMTLISCHYIVIYNVCDINKKKYEGILSNARLVDSLNLRNAIAAG